MCRLGICNRLYTISSRDMDENNYKAHKQQGISYMKCLFSVFRTTCLSNLQLEVLIGDVVYTWLHCRDTTKEVVYNNRGKEHRSRATMEDGKCNHSSNIQVQLILNKHKQ